MVAGPRADPYVYTPKPTWGFGDFSQVEMSDPPPSVLLLLLLLFVSGMTEDEMLEKICRTSKCVICKNDAVLIASMYANYSSEGVEKGSGYANVDLCRSHACMKTGLEQSGMYERRAQGEDEWDVSMWKFTVFLFETREKCVYYRENYSADEWPPYEQYCTE